MDPVHLDKDELDYELALRHVNNLSNPRTKTSALRELLTKERAGFEMEPKNSHHLFSC